MEESLKERAVNGVVWSSIGKFGSMVVTFVSNLVLARLLAPDDWGCIGMLTIFINISQVFVTSGLGTALIQKKEVDSIDYTTVFYYNLVVAILFVILLYFGAPFVAQFYNLPLLCDVLRIQSLSLILHSLSLIPAVQLQKELQFKSLNIRHLIASVCGASIAIIMAFRGFGVWSLVANGLVAALCSTLLLWRMSSWRPSWAFSWISFKQLFSFGGIMLLSSLVETVFSNIQGLMIGKMYSSRTLGYYDQARKLEAIPTTTLSNVVEAVSFPIVSKLQDDRNKVKQALRMQYSAITYLNFPLMLLLIVIADLLIHFLYGEKWLPSVPYFQVLCVAGLVYNISTLSTSTIKALGRAKVYLIMQIVKRVVGLIIIIIGACISIWALLIGVVISNYINFVINMIVIRKYVGYGFRQLSKDIIPTFFVALLSVIPIYLIEKYLKIPLLCMILLSVCLYLLFYIVFSRLFKIETIGLYKELIMKKFVNRIIRRR